MKRIITIAIICLPLAACGTTQDAMTYLQSNTGFCSAGTKWMHNSDGTATKLFAQNGQPIHC